MKAPIHFTHDALLQPTNPITVNLIGAGGNGSLMLTHLARMNHSLISLGHAGLDVNVFDDDTVAEPNLGRQQFAHCELGLPKAVALVSRTNRFYGTHWKAINKKFEKNGRDVDNILRAGIYISCVDTASSRFGIAETIQQICQQSHYMNKALYWLDMGNGQQTGQAILSTIGTHHQPPSEKFTTVGNLPFITEEYMDLLLAQDDTDTPSCSLAEALEKQDLFINPAITALAASLLWKTFRQGYILEKGFFLNLNTYTSTAIPLLQLPLEITV